MTAREKEQRPTDAILTRIFDQLSHQGAGGRRVDHRSLLPETDLPDEGSIPEEFLPDVQGFDWFDPKVWANAAPNNVDLSNVTPATGPGKDGSGKDWFRGGEAPNNYGNRHQPLYKSRREFAVSIAPKIEDMFGVSAQGGAGHMRQPKASHKAPGGPSSNSDHYSGGAIDFFGSKEELDQLRDWLTEQPFTSFVRWQTESHYDHVHLSFDLGWVAQNWFEGQQLPELGQASAQAAAPELPESDTPGSVLSTQPTVV